MIKIEQPCQGLIFKLKKLYVYTYIIQNSRYVNLKNRLPKDLH